MFKIIKKPAVLILTIIYAIGVFMAYSSSLFQDLQYLRYENKIKETNHVQTIIFSEKDWQNLDNTHEIKYNNTYYDVVSFQKINSNIIIKAINDSTESEFRLLYSQLFSKHKIPFSDKKKTSLFSKQIALKEPQANYLKFNFLTVTSRNFNIFFDLKTNSYHQLFLHPPC
jgi:hypothetical protein